MNQIMENTHNFSVFHSNNNNIIFKDYFNSVFPHLSFFSNSSILKLTMVSLFIINITTLGSYYWIGEFHII